ncbi:hypothetical protein AVEN_231305-1 [Araneus ventricosus]|uniref:Major facilitator superfamily (MFS) profile domain-containing protein n=1 Tax=Araneus ventricosus TaxID=182803 RepID=A0A4Y2CHJ7_ARAVE|nr:hypothetical protein AVEN_231305-1 [Araneus ventricosus]
MENSLRGESSFSGFDETQNMEEEEVNDGARTELSVSPSEPENLFFEAARKLSSYEHSLETLVKRFDKDGIQTDSAIQHSEGYRNSGAFADNAPGRADLSAGGDHSDFRRERGTSNDPQKYVKIQIPFRTAEIILRILNEDLDKNQRSALKEAESYLNSARQNLVTVKKLLQRHLENSDRSQEPILIQTNEIADDMFAISDKLSEKLVECQVQNLSELLVRSMKDETRLSMLAKRPQTRNDENTINTMAMISDALSRSKVFFVIIFCCVASYFVVRLMMLYLEQEKEVLEKAYLVSWQPFQEEMKQLFVYLRKAFDWLIQIPFEDRNKMDEIKNLFTVNKKLLPVKLHYLFGFGGYGGWMPFQSLIGKGLGISASAVGFTNTTLMVLTLLSKPGLGTLADYFRNIRVFLISLILLNVFSSLPLILMSPIEGKAQESPRTGQQLPNSSDASNPLTFSINNECIEKVTENSEITCHVLQIENSSKSGEDVERVKEIQLYSIRKTDLQKLVDLNSTLMNATHLQLDSDLTYQDPFQLLDLKCEPDTHLCNIQTSASSTNEYKSFQFWAFSLTVILAGLAFNNTLSLSDCACYEILGEQRHLYGRQRLFGSAGWALACLLSGYLSDHTTGDNSRKDYSPGFYVMAYLMVTDALILCKMPLVKMKLSSNIYRDVKKVFQSVEIILFAVGGILSGSMASIVFYYELWYLQDLGANQSLLGWAITSQALIAETSFFLISGWFVRKFGPFNCLIISFAAYALRFGCYSIITNPWWALLIDITQGLTFALFHAAMTNFASTKAPEGVEGTIFGIFGGLIDGLGQAFGTLVCGVAFDKLGGRLTFTMASIFSATSAVAFVILHRLTVMRSNRTKRIYISSETQGP